MQKEEEQPRSRQPAAGISSPAAEGLHHGSRKKIAERQGALREESVDAHDAAAVFVGSVHLKYGISGVEEYEVEIAYHCDEQIGSPPVPRKEHQQVY